MTLGFPLFYCFLKKYEKVCNFASKEYEIYKKKHRTKGMMRKYEIIKLTQDSKLN